MNLKIKKIILSVYNCQKLGKKGKIVITKVYSKVVPKGGHPKKEPTFYAFLSSLQQKVAHQH